jgi:hypothetical protein
MGKDRIMKTRPEVRWALTAALALLPATAVPERSLPLDAAGNIRVAEAPFVERTRFGSALEIDGVGTIAGRFSSAAESVAVIDQRLIDRTGHLLQNRQPGAYRTEPLQFEAGIEALEPLLAWFQQVKDQSFLRVPTQPSQDDFRRSARLSLLGPDGRVIARFILTRAWPSRVEWSSEDRVTFELAVDEIRLDTQLR